MFKTRQQIADEYGISRKTLYRKLKNLEEFVDQYNQLGFKGFDLYKDLSIKKMNLFTAVVNQNPDLGKMNDQELQQILLRAKKMVEDKL